MWNTLFTMHRWLYCILICVSMWNLRSYKVTVRTRDWLVFGWSDCVGRTCAALWWLPEDDPVTLSVSVMDMNPELELQSANAWKRIRKRGFQRVAVGMLECMNVCVRNEQTSSRSARWNWKQTQDVGKRTVRSVWLHIYRASMNTVTYSNLPELHVLVGKQKHHILVQSWTVSYTEAF